MLEVGRFFDLAGRVCCESASMRRALKIRVSFSPTRMSSEYLRETYELLTGSTERRIVSAPEVPNPAEAGREVARVRRRS
jgi:hypothetical protein